MFPHLHDKKEESINTDKDKLIVMYEVIAKMDKQNRITIPQVVRELIGDPKPGDVIKVMVVGKVEGVKVGDQSPLEEGLNA